ncbi:MAG: rod shape-determining protein MreD [Desulfomonile sp.]|nr:rod shape-determining protein MreD [Desulfomonile sp.]
MIDLIFISLAGMVTLGLQTTSMAFLVSSAYKPDLMLVLIVWAGLRLPFAMGAAFAFVAGVGVDTLSGSPLGLFGLIYALVCVACGYLGGVVRIEGRTGRTILVLVAALWTGVAILLARLLRGPIGFGWHVTGWIIAKALITTGAALVVFPCIDWARLGFSKLMGERRPVSRPTDYA